MAKKDMTEAPIKDPTRGKLSEAALLGLRAASGPAAGLAAGAPVAMAVLTKAAATTTAQETFFMSMGSYAYGFPRFEGFA
ncbi:hypothetical protein G2W53_043212 [Senna tora]|uniref:Uncharacterized protein n=1 Tax=Senna tora TaxID=362788 RepID=A0A834SII1_9FABA|nr:hypothetical protein G2W53_043212 [Senna tora]